VEIAPESAHGDVAVSLFFWIGGSTPDEQAALAETNRGQALEERRSRGAPEPRLFALGQIFLLSSIRSPISLGSTRGGQALAAIVCGRGGMRGIRCDRMRV